MKGRRTACLGLGLLALWLCAGCAPGEVRSAADIEAAIEAYLRERTDLRLDRMSVRADRIRYDGSRAVASVSITASDDPDAVMQMVYELALGPDGWTVVPTEAAPAPPAEHGVPPGHANPSLPPGHPPLNSDPAL